MTEAEEPKEVEKEQDEVPDEEVKEDEPEIKEKLDNMDTAFIENLEEVFRTF